MEPKDVYRRLVAAFDRLSGSWSLEEGLSGLAHMARDVLEADATAIALMKDSPPHLKIVAATGLSATFINGYGAAVDHPAVQRVLFGGEDAVADGRAAGDEKLEPFRLEDHAGPLMATSISAMHQPIGVVMAARDEPRAFSEDDLLILKLTARVAAACHYRCSLYDERRRLTAIDPVTGLWSFEFFCHRLTEEIARCRRHKMALSLMLIDLSSFGRFKDVYGEEAGQELYASFIVAVRGTVRGIDLLGHFSLHQLLVGMPQTDLRGALAAAERVRIAVEHAGLSKPEVAVAAGIGVSSLRGADDDVGQMLDRAQKALFLANMKGSSAVGDESRL